MCASKPFLTVAMIAAALWRPGPAAAQAPAFPSDAELEHFLRHAEVVGAEPVGAGITNPQKLTLELDGVRRSAIFKDVDVFIEETAHAGRWELGFTDRYTFEVAAYRLDRLLALGLVPVTVVREVDGRQGSVQHWVEDVTTLTEGLKDDREIPNFDLLLQRLTLMYVFDSLIGNIDRNTDNVLLNLAEDRFYLIDHSRTFRSTRDVEDLTRRRVVPIPAPVAESLRALDRSILERHLGDLVSGAQARAILKRRDLVLEQLEELGLLPG